MANLRKADIVSRVATTLDTSTAKGEEALNAVLLSIEDALINGDKVVLTGFGSFSVRQVKPRNIKPILGPQAGKIVTIPSHKRVGFTAGAKLTRKAAKN